MTEEQAFHPLHPILTDECKGVQEAEASFLEAFKSDKLHHAWLIKGPKGIGKATFAYRAAKFLLAHGGGDSSDSLFGEALGPQTFETLSLAPENDTLKRVKSGGHGDLLVVERSFDPKTKKMRKAIVVDDIRKGHDLFQNTSAEGGWRIIVVDSADEMNRNAANALLKILEEPPEKAILFLVSHTPGKLLPTIKSRCRQLALNPLSDADLSQALQSKYTDLPPEDLSTLTVLSEGSLGTAIRLYEEGGLTLYDEILQLLGTITQPDLEAVHKVAGQLSAAKAIDKYNLFMDLLSQFVGHMVRFSAAGIATQQARGIETALYTEMTAKCGVEPWLVLWEKMNEDRVITDAINMDKKLMLVTLISDMSTLSRGKV